MSYNVRVIGNNGDDSIRSLAGFLSEEAELRGRIDVVDAPPRVGELGSLVDLIEVAVGSGGAVTVLMTAITAWIQSRGSDVTIRVEASNGRKVEFDAKRIKKADAATVRQIIAEANTAIEG